MLAILVITGASSSATVTWKVRVLVLVPSVAVQTTELVPLENTIPFSVAADTGVPPLMV